MVNGAGPQGHPCGKTTGKRGANALLCIFASTDDNQHDDDENDSETSDDDVDHNGDTWNDGSKDLLGCRGRSSTRGSGHNRRPTTITSERPTLHFHKHRVFARGVEKGRLPNSLKV